MFQTETASSISEAEKSLSPKTERVAIWAICVGGFGAQSGIVMRRLYDAEDRQFPLVLQQIDTDPSTKTAADVTTFINIDDRMLDAMRGSPSQFGRDVKAVLDRLQPYLNGDPAPGARTTRPISQLFYNYHRDRVIREMRRALSQLVHLDQVSRIVPFIISSTGGGTGSALTVILLREFLDAQFRHQLLMGLQTPIDRPVVFVTDPYAHARRCGRMQACRIQANMYAFRLETDYLLYRHAAAQFIFHLGLANSQGVILDDANSTATVLGHCAYYMARDWQAVRSILCDNAEINLSSRYGGDDTFERTYLDTSLPTPSHTKSNGQEGA